MSSTLINFYTNNLTVTSLSIISFNTRGFFIFIKAVTYLTVDIYIYSWYNVENKMVKNSNKYDKWFAMVYNNER